MNIKVGLVGSFTVIEKENMIVTGEPTWKDRHIDIIVSNEFCSMKNLLRETTFLPV